VGALVVEAVRRASSNPLNLHLMIVEPEHYLEDFIRAGANHLLVQSEPSSTIHLHRVLSRIRELGAKAGVVLDPASPICFAEHVLHLCDIVLVMTVNPGFGGQKFLPEMVHKTSGLRWLCETAGMRAGSEVDGGQNGESVHQVVATGGDAMVAGSAIVKSPDYKVENSTLRRNAFSESR